jgi:hypothetical protein
MHTSSSRPRAPGQLPAFVAFPFDDDGKATKDERSCRLDEHHDGRAEQQASIGG